MKNLSINVILALGQMFASAFIYLSLSFFLSDKVAIDCLLVALSIPSLFLVIWTGSISYQLTPVLVSQYVAGQLNIDFCKNLISKLLLIILAITVLLLIFHSLLIKFIVPGFTPEKAEITKGLVKWALLLIPVQLSISTFNSLFITLKRNIFSASVALIGNTLIIILLFMQKEEITPHKIIISILCGNTLILSVYLYEYFTKYFKSPEEPTKHNFNFIKFFKELSIIIFILMVSRSIALIQNAFGSNMKEGSITLLTYTNYITNIVITVLITPILNVYYAKHCEWWNNKEKTKIFYSFQTGTFILIMLFLISASFLYLSHEFLMEQLSIVSDKINFEIDINIMKLMILSTFCLVMSAFIGRIFYIGGYFKLVNALDLLAVVIYTIFGYFLSKSFGLLGLYLSFFLYSLVTIGLYLIVLKKKTDFSMIGKKYSSNRILIVKILALVVISIILNFSISQILIKAAIGIVVFISGILFLFYAREKLSLDGEG